MRQHRQRRRKADRPQKPYKSKRDHLKLCHCTTKCGKLLSFRQRRRHYHKASEQGLFERIRASESVASTGSELSDDVKSDSHEWTEQIIGSAGPDDVCSDSEISDSERVVDLWRENVTPDISTGLIGNRPLGNSALDEELDEEELVEDGWDWTAEDVDDEVLDPELQDITLQAQEADLSAIREGILSQNDRDNIRAFNFLVKGKITHSAFHQMRYTFRHKMNLDSEYRISRRMKTLAQATSMKYDCCINSCILYTSQFVSLTMCPYCGQSRYKANGKPRRRFTYFPLIPRLQGFFQSRTQIQLMDYRASFQPGDEITDVFDGAHYRRLKRERVHVDNAELPHQYFSDSRDIALGLCTDSYLLYTRRRNSPSATPILLINYNIPPNLCTHQKYLICIGVIPGPRQPANIASFLSPLDDELVQLAFGIPTFDTYVWSIFDLHAYIIFKLGDMLAIEKFLNIKGHNAIFPCRSCKIKSVRGLGRTYYVPLIPPKNHPERQLLVTWKADDLPIRTHQDFVRISTEIRFAPSKAAKERIAKETGIRALPGLHRVRSLDFAQSIPWEWFHLLLENVIPNLVDLWTGEFKGLDIGEGEFRIAPHIWKIVGEETTAAVQHIPASFVRVLGNIATNRSSFTAESWCFWFVYLAPYLLENRFPQRKYYTHMRELGDLMEIMLRFQIRASQVDDVEARLRKWVENFEKYYYQYRIEQLSACTLTIHGLLHIAEGIRYCGPIWSTWSFFMERYCGALHRSLRSRSQLWSNLDNIVEDHIILEQLSVRYEVSDELAWWDDRPSGDDPVGSERVVEGYDDYILRPPFTANTRNDPLLQKRIAHYLAMVLGKRESEVKKRVGIPSFFAGKFRIRGAGDLFRTAAVARRPATPERRNCYVKYEFDLETRDGVLIHRVHHGDLEKIFVLQLPADRFFGKLSNSALVLAQILPWETTQESRDGRLKNTFISSNKASVVTDIRSVKAVVGLVSTGGRWGIVDREYATATTRFTEQGLLEGPDDINFA